MEVYGLEYLMNTGKQKTKAVLIYSSDLMLGVKSIPTSPQLLRCSRLMPTKPTTRSGEENSIISRFQSVTSSAIHNRVR